MRAALKQHAFAYVVIAFAIGLYGTAIPVGESVKREWWQLDPWPPGTSGSRLEGTVEYCADRYGMPAGTFVHGNTQISAFRVTTSRSGSVALPTLPPDLEAAIRQKHPDAFGPEGWALQFGDEILPQPVCLLGALVLTCLWWTGVRRWRWSPHTRRHKNLAATAGLTLWPWVFLTCNGWLLLGTRFVQEVNDQWVAPRFAVAGTSLLLSLGVVILLTYKPAQEGDLPSAPADSTLV